MQFSSGPTRPSNWFTHRYGNVVGSLLVLLATLGATASYADGFGSMPSANLYVATNKADGNTVVHFAKDASDRFQVAGEYSTGGLGTGDLEIPALQFDPTHPLANGDDPLISAYAVVALEDGKHLVVVNPGDSSISLMRVNDNGGVSLVNKVKSSDRFPVSVATSGQYVVGASVGKDNNHGSLSAYMIDSDGWLMPIANSRRDLSARPSTVAFSADGRFIVVTELVTGKIKTFGLNDSQLSSKPISVVDSPRSESRFQAIPVGFDVIGTELGSNVIVSEARFLTPEFGLREESGVVPQSPKYSWQTGSLSSYRLDISGNLELVSADVLTGSNIEGGEIANCWVTLSPDGRTLWAANALSSSISAFNIGKDGDARLKNVTAYKDDSELLFFSDMAVNRDGTELYQLIGNKGEVAVFKIDGNGNLTLQQTVGQMPALGTFGLAVIER